MSKSNFIHVVKNTVVYAFGNFAVRLIGLILVPIFTNTNYVSVADFGVFSLLEVGIQVLMAFMGLGLYMGISRFYWDKKYASQQKHLFNSLFILVFVFGLLLGAPFVLGAEKVSVLMFDSAAYALVVQMAVVSAWMQAVLLGVSTLLKLQSKSAYYSSINIVRSLLTFALTYLLVVKQHKSLEGIYIAQVISLLVAFVVSVPAFARQLSLTPNFGVLKEVYKYSLPIMVSSVMILLISVFDKYILNATSGLEDVAVYSLGFRLSNAIKIFVITSVQLALSPVLMKKINHRDHGAFYNNVLQLFSVGLMFVILASAIFGLEFLHLITSNPVYLDAYWVFVIISTGFFFEMVKDNIIIGLNIEKKTVLSGTISLVMAIISFILYKIFTPLGGMEMVAGVFVAVQFVTMWVVYFFAQMVHPIPYKMGNVFKIVLIGAFLFGCSYCLNSQALMLKLILRVAIIALFPLLVIVFKIISVDEIKEMLANFASKSTQKEHK